MPPRTSSEPSEGLVSVIVPVYNRAVFLEEAVNSVVVQSHRPVEIILVDDGSTDDTSEHITALVAANPEVVRSIRIDNRGPGGARQAGLDIARGEFIQYLDSDDVLEPEKSAIQVRALRANPECGVAYGITRLIDENGRELVCPYKGSGKKRDYLFPELLWDRWWNTHTPLYRRSLCDAVGPWTTMRMGEDWEYDARVGALRTKLIFCDELVSSHRDHEQGRLTRGPLRADIARDQATLIPRLLECAIGAGVSASAPEMRHFSRWAFLVARQAAAFGFQDLARDCLTASIKADQASRARVDAYIRLSRIMGWRMVGRLCLHLDTLRKRARTGLQMKRSC